MPKASKWKELATRIQGDRPDLLDALASLILGSPIGNRLVDAVQAAHRDFTTDEEAARHALHCLLEIIARCPDHEPRYVAPLSTIVSAVAHREGAAKWRDSKTTIIEVCVALGQVSEFVTAVWGLVRGQEEPKSAGHALASICRDHGKGKEPGEPVLLPDGDLPFDERQAVVWLAGSAPPPTDFGTQRVGDALQVAELLVETSRKRWKDEPDKHPVALAVGVTRCLRNLQSHATNPPQPVLDLLKEELDLELDEIAGLVVGFQALLAFRILRSATERPRTKRWREPDPGAAGTPRTQAAPPDIRRAPHTRRPIAIAAGSVVALALSIGVVLAYDLVGLDQEPVASGSRPPFLASTDAARTTDAGRRAEATAYGSNSDEKTVSDADDNPDDPSNDAAERDQAHDLFDEALAPNEVAGGCAVECSLGRGEEPLAAFKPLPGAPTSVAELAALVLGPEPRWFTLVVGESGVGKTDLALWLRCEACRRGFRVMFRDARPDAEAAADPKAFLELLGTCGQNDDRLPVPREPGAPSPLPCVAILAKFDAWDVGDRRWFLDEFFRTRTTTDRLVLFGRPQVEEAVGLAFPGVKPTATLVPVDCAHAAAWLATGDGVADRLRGFGAFLKERHIPLEPGHASDDVPCPLWRTSRALRLLVAAFDREDSAYDAWSRILTANLREVARAPYLGDPIGVVIDSLRPTGAFDATLCHDRLASPVAATTSATVADVRRPLSGPSPDTICQRFVDEDPLLGWALRGRDVPPAETRAFLKVAGLVRSPPTATRVCEDVLAFASSGRSVPRLVETFVDLAVSTTLRFACPAEMATVLCDLEGEDSGRVADRLVRAQVGPRPAVATDAAGLAPDGADHPDATSPDVGSCPEIVAVALAGAGAVTRPISPSGTDAADAGDENGDTVTTAPPIGAEAGPPIASDAVVDAGMTADSPCALLCKDLVARCGFPDLPVPACPNCDSSGIALPACEKGCELLRDDVRGWLARGIQFGFCESVKDWLEL